jgi:HD-GYP domain-containing protein (c-di-GMP phosphodiesterase class II)/DNA-binding CsgD family transcriptional regulator
MPPVPTPPASLRLAELLVGLSLVADAGIGQEPGEAARACLIAARLADALDVGDASDVYYTTLLQHVGCTAFAHEGAALLGGDEIAVKAAALRTDFGDPRDVLTGYLPRLAPGAPALTRLRAAGVAVVHSRAIRDGYSRANCEVGARTALRLGLGEGVERGLGEIFEQWDGKGVPRGLRGEAIALPARFAQVAEAAALFSRLGGSDVAIAVLRRRAGRTLDPVLAEELCRRAGPLLAELEAADVLHAAVEAEPTPHVRVSSAGLDDACRAFGDAVDLKTPFHHGHAAGVAELAAGAAARLGLDVVELRRAALLHDLGRAAVPNRVWERAGPLTTSDWEQVRLHAYQTERILSRCGPLAALATLAGSHHERLDGSGYHRQATASSLAMPARVLAAADAYQAMTQPRAHRAALAPEAAATELEADARSGRLDADAVATVLAEAGAGPRPRARLRPAGLTERQVEVLRLVARGLSNPQIAERLVVSRRTAEHHVQDVYAKIGVSSRAAAALFAMEHDLLAYSHSSGMTGGMRPG